MLFVAIGGISLAISVFLTISYFKMLSKRDKNLKQKSEANYQEEKQRWNMQKNVGKLIYCQQHDIIFDPPDLVIGKPSMIKYLGNSR